MLGGLFQNGEAVEEGLLVGKGHFGQIGPSHGSALAPHVHHGAQLVGYFYRYLSQVRIALVEEQLFDGTVVKAGSGHHEGKPREGRDDGPRSQNALS